MRLVCKTPMLNSPSIGIRIARHQMVRGHLSSSESLSSGHPVDPGSGCRPRSVGGWGRVGGQQIDCSDSGWRRRRCHAAERPESHHDPSDRNCSAVPMPGQIIFPLPVRTIHGDHHQINLSSTAMLTRLSKACRVAAPQPLGGGTLVLLQTADGAVRCASRPWGRIWCPILLHSWQASLTPSRAHGPPCHPP